MTMTESSSSGTSGSFEREQPPVRPLDESRLGPVMTGVDVGSRWELRDGPHPLPQDPDAVAEQLLIWTTDSSSKASVVSTRLSRGEYLAVSQEVHGRGRLSYLTVRCGEDVATVEVLWNDGSTDQLETVPSTATGQRWVVVPLTDDRRPDVLRARAMDGTVIVEHITDDPRVARRLPKER